MLMHSQFADMMLLKVLLRLKNTSLPTGLFLLLASAPLEVSADSVTLAWDASTDPTVVGYHLYSGTASRSYTNLVDAGSLTSATLSNLTQGVTYYFAATTYTLAGLESDYSSEAAYTVPVPNLPPTLDPIANLSLNENGGAQTVNLTGISSGAPSQTQTLAVSAISSNPSLIPNPVVAYISPSATGGLTLSPALNASGSATISVTVNNGGASNNTVVRTFTVTVNPVNLPPTLDPIANLTLNENGGAQTVNLTGISSGAPSQTQTLAVSAISSNPSLIPNPVVAYISPSATGGLTLSPALNASGSATISVTVNNGGASNNTVVRTFTVTVNPVNLSPTLDPIANLTLNENGGAQTVNLTGISSGAASQTQTLAVSAISSNPSLIPNPAVAYTSPSATGGLTLSPALNASGSATISVTVNNGGASNNTVVRTFSVTVNPVNLSPTLDPIANLTLNENGGAQTVNLTGISSGAASQTQTLVVSAISSNPSLIPNPAVAYTSPSATGGLTLSPALNASGSATISVTVNNGGASNSTIVRTFTVTVNPVNLSPTLDPIANLTLNENGGAQTVNLTGIGSGAASQTQTLAVSAISSNPSLIPNPVVAYTSPSATGGLTLSPALNASGSATISVTVNNGGASNNTVVRTFTVTVNPVNLSPTLDPIANLTLNENGGAQTVNLTGIGSGAASQTQTLAVSAISSNPSLIPNPVVAYTSPSATGGLTLSPALNASGSATISVTVNNGGASNNTVVRTFSVTVNPVNLPPTLDPIANLTLNENGGAQTVNLTGIGSGAASQTQVLSVNAFSSNPSLIANPSVNYSSPSSTGSLTLTPTANSFGLATITVMVDNSGISNNTVIRTFTVTVSPANVPPTLDPIVDLTLNENASPQTVALTGISSGASNEIQTLAVSAASSNPALIPTPTITYTSPNTNGTLILSPITNAFGTATITVTVDDGQATNNLTARSFVITVSQATPSPAVLTNVLIAPNTAFRYLLSAPYPNGDRFSYSLGAGAPAGAKISKNRSLTYFTWTPTTAQALSTNLIQIVVTDLTRPSLSTNETILIAVSDYLALTLGSSSVPAGQSATLPLSLASSSGVTNLSFTVDWPASGLTSPSLVIASPGITASSVQDQATNLLISLQTAPGQPLQGSNVVAQLKFQTLAAQPSAFITLALRNLSASKPDASAYLTYLPTAGQVAIVSSKPLLAPASTSSTARSLTAFGTVGASYQLQYSTNLLSAGPWYPLMTYSQTNIQQTLNVDPAIPLIFYRLQVQ